MSGDDSHIRDWQAAMVAIGHGLVDSGELEEVLGPLIAKLLTLNDGKPWGTSEAGELFEHVYLTDKGGAPVVLDAVPKVAARMPNAFRAAAGGVTTVVGGDQDTAASFLEIDLVVTVDGQELNLRGQMVAGNEEREAMG